MSGSMPSVGGDQRGCALTRAAFRFSWPERGQGVAMAAAREAVRLRYLPERYVLNMESIRASWPTVNSFMQASSV